MTIKYKDEESGAEYDVFKQDEVDAMVKEKDTEITRLKALDRERGENFKRYNEMTEEQRDAHSENELELIRRNDSLQDELKSIQTGISTRDMNDRTNAKNSIMASFHGNKEDVKALIESKYEILSGMPENTPEEIKSRAVEASKLAGIAVNSSNYNPVYAQMDGEAPPVSKGDGFLESDRGKEAEKQLSEALGETPK